MCSPRNETLLRTQQEHISDTSMVALNDHNQSADRRVGQRGAFAQTGIVPKKYPQAFNEDKGEISL